MSSTPHGSPSQTPAETAPGPVRGEEMAAANVLSHREWRDIVSGYVANAHEDRSPLSTLIIDIDATKAANDELGHSMGNRLIDMVDRLNRVVVASVRTENNPRYPDRDLDVVTSHTPKLLELGDVVEGLESPEPRAERTGGDEFGIALPQTDWEGAKIVAKRLREAFEEELKLPENWPLAKIGAGISIGIATLEPGMDTSDFLHLADRRMYADKLRQMRPLSPEEEAKFMAAVQYLEEAGVRPRDVPKYIQLLGASAVTHAFEDREREAAGQMTMIPSHSETA